jgi:L-fuculose-phosphate aldolase
VPITHAETALRAEIVEAVQQLETTGLNHGTAGNISVRHGERMLITPSGVSCGDLTPSMISSMPLSCERGQWEGPLKPSSEWRFHLAILRSRPGIHAVVHTHSPYATALSVARRPIPACHYMIAAFGGMDVRVAAYATFGTARLSDSVVEALRDRQACLIANHGMLAAGSSLKKAMWRAVELEALARTYHLSLTIGGPVLLSEGEVEDARRRFGTYGLQLPQKELNQ